MSSPVTSVQLAFGHSFISQLCLAITNSESCAILQVYNGRGKVFMPMCGYFYATHEKRSLGPQSFKITQLQRAEDYKNHTAMLNTCTP